MDKNTQDILLRLEKLEDAVFGSVLLRDKKALHPAGNSKLIFSINERAFVKRYAGNKSGPKKFVLLLAYLTKGEVGKDIELSKIRKIWDKMSAKNMLGKFNLFYSNDAKNRGWVDSKKHGTYALTDEWGSIL